MKHFILVGSDGIFIEDVIYLSEAPNLMTTKEQPKYDIGGNQIGVEIVDVPVTKEVTENVITNEWDEVTKSMVQVITPVVKTIFVKNPNYIETKCPEGFILPKWNFVTEQWEEGGQLPLPTLIQQITVLKNQLSSTDYKIIKCVEYQLAGLGEPYDLIMLHLERQEIRDKINLLESQI